jgi:STE24 endopeptidase
MLWMCRTLAPLRNWPLNASQGTMVFVGGLALVVLFLGLWSRMVARNARGSNVNNDIKRLHKSILTARMLIPVWFGVAVFLLGWPDLVGKMLGPVKHWPVELPGMLIGILPAVLAWMALWWAQYPADCAMREQSFLLSLEDESPSQNRGSFRDYFIANLRLQVLFTIVPVALIVFVHDIACVLLWKYFQMDLRSANPTSTEAMTEMALQVLSIAMVVLFGPEVLRRVLHTQHLPDNALRARLEELCRRTGMKYRDILLWKTNNYMGNAAVMGLIPQMRYILLSDVLLDTMSEKQIEAVFAHEIGHVKHGHMAWYVVLIATLLMVFVIPGQFVQDWLNKAHLPAWLTPDMIISAVVLALCGGFFLVFGFVSRWFERQADVFAARTIQREAADPAAEPMLVSYASSSHVGHHGATVFASALHRVAVINNIPVSAGNFTHGSIADRMDYLHTLSIDPTRTTQFDRTMSVLYAALVLALLVCGAAVMVAMAA